VKIRIRRKTVDELMNSAVDIMIALPLSLPALVKLPFWAWMITYLGLCFIIRYVRKNIEIIELEEAE